MAVRFFNWEYRPAVERPSLEGGVEAFFVPTGEGSWRRCSPVEVWESGNPLTEAAFLEMFPGLPPLPAPAPFPASKAS